MTRTHWSIQDRVDSLCNTSVEDMHSSLYFYSYLNISDVQTIRLGLATCKRRYEKTKVKLLERKLKRMESDLAKAKALFTSVNKEQPSAVGGQVSAVEE